jgi:hypothetical protein
MGAKNAGRGKKKPHFISIAKRAISIIALFVKTSKISI